MIDKNRLNRILKRLDDVQKEIDNIHAELLTELNTDELTAAERAEVENIRSENEYKTFDDWEKEKPLD
jgi:hypothetical protein